MSKFASFAEYPSRSLVGAEAALLTAWVSLERYHESLVLVGGLAVKYLIQPVPKSQPGAITMDVDLGVALAVEGGQYGSIADDLEGQGFKRDEQGRYVRQFEAAVAEFRVEATAANPGSARAVATLRQHFTEAEQSGPVRCAAFAFGHQPPGAEERDRQRQIIQQMVTVGRTLLGE